MASSPSSYVRADVLDDDEWLPPGSRASVASSQRTSTPLAAVTFVKASVGVGLFSLPFALRHSGIWLGLLCLALIALTSWYTATLLMECVVEHNLPSYAEVGREALGRPGVVLANTAITITQLGAHVVHLLFISTALVTLVPAVPRYAWLLILSPLLVGLTLIPSIHKLRIITLPGMAMLVASMLVVVGYAFSVLPPSDVVAGQIRHAPEDMFIFLGTAVYVFEGINMLVPVYRAMRHKESFFVMFRWTSASTATVFTLFAVICYVCFLDAVRQVVLFNLRPPVLFVMLGLVVVELLLTFPVVFFPIADILRSASPVMDRFAVKLVVHALLVYFVIVLAGVVPRVSLAVALAGSFGNAMTGMVLPTFFHIVLFWDSSSWLKRVLHMLLLLVGVFAMSVTATFAIMDILRSV